ncbi:hypothetical protein LEP1GSC188_4157 [Leptospira weilii serovar Topaz str. LT2116]|uniref:Uncharacterized protein n=1 Tax=Leptospira weilii serovar Topaz str. LT2116 TaxID=1088540 RepID=M3ERV0_9LEPT|nr:hypothetical protein LEP1GSC188_4157 [Leptospira weilii serovar Topaz str. LT2116]
MLKLTVPYFIGISNRQVVVVENGIPIIPGWKFKGKSKFGRQRFKIFYR